MRIIAVLNHDRDGVTTDARAIVGEISLGGTMSLVMLGAVAGVLGGLFYLGLRRWLWVPPTWRGPAFAAVTLLTVGHVLFDTANVDFQIFEPVAVVIALFAALFLMNGLLLVPLADRIHPEPAYPAGSRVPRAVAFVIALVCLFGLILMIDTFRTMINDAGTCYTAAGGGEGCAIREDDLVP
ncbi:MAG: hypothetical protein HY873_02065 [Chloroflexi bacterium]|nr:hypothetical protein [Chloroflexota bacterium]